MKQNTQRAVACRRALSCNLNIQCSSLVRELDGVYHMLGGTQQARVRAPRRLINHECVQCLYSPRIRAGGEEECW